MSKPNKEKYDVIVVGAGPGGLAAAIELAKNKREVLLIEKNKIIGPKVCAGGLTIKDFDLGIPKKLADKFFKKIYLHTPLQISTLENKKPSVATVDREKLGQWMKKQAEKFGVKILKERVINLDREKNEIILKSGKKLKYNYLIGADGSNSIIRQKLNIPKEKILVLYQYLVKKIYPKMEVFVDIEKFGPFYIWIFPHKNFTSVGAYCDSKIFSVKKNKNNFEIWLKNHKVDLKDAKYEAWTINYDYRGFEFGNIFLVGDAGGFTSGLTGEGMYFAMVSGIEAAKKIINPSYNLKELDKILKIKKSHEKFLASLEVNKVLSKIELELINLISRTMLFDEKIINKLV